MKIFCSFAIAGDGQIYEGRGFNVIGAHAPKYNGRSVGICLIGDWSGIQYTKLKIGTNGKNCFVYFRRTTTTTHD